MRKVATFVAVGLMLCGTALAGPLLNHAKAWTDPVTSITWTGSTSIADPMSILTATIEWAVFSTEAWPDTGFTGLGYTPTAGEFVYCYQVENTGMAPIAKYAVKMLDSNEANNIGSFDLGGLAPKPAPAFGGPPPNLDTANWEWVYPLNPPASRNLMPGQVSDGLAYSSINKPMEYDFLVHDGGIGVEHIVEDGDPGVPSPSDEIPELATLALLAVGFVAVLRRKR